MAEPRRITGFMALAEDIICDRPGLTAQEIVSLAEEHSVNRGIPLSAAANPSASLTATLHKCHADYGIERMRGRDGRYRFYTDKVRIPVTPSPVGPSHEPNSHVGSELVEALSANGSTGSIRIDRHIGSESREIPLEKPLGEVEFSQAHPADKHLGGSDEKCCIELPSNQASKIKALVDLGLYPSEHDAHGDLVKKGLEAVLANLSV